LKRKILFWLITLSLPLAFFAAAAAFFWVNRGPLLLQWLEFAGESRVIAALPAADRERLYEKIALSTPGPWDVDPDPAVGRVFKRNAEFELQGVEVKSNNASQRSETRYVPKAADSFRILVLGDSIVMGHGVAEKDRMGEQMEALLRARGIAPGGKRVEVYTLGMNSWNGVTEATYLTSRFSDYAPDIVVMLLATNDIDWNLGVTGGGQVTARFSPLRRALGSGVFRDGAAAAFGPQALPWSPLAAGLSGAGREIWRETFRRIRRLQDVAEASGAKVLLCAPAHDPIFRSLAVWYRQAEGVTLPLLFTRYDTRPENVLPNDPHPSAAGHALEARHFLAALGALGWLPLKDGDLPELPPELDLEFQHSADWAQVKELQDWAFAELPEELDLEQMTPLQAAGFLGGLYPEERKTATASPPFASIRAGLVLRRDPEKERIRVALEVPARPELFPFEVTLSVNGAPRAKLALEDVAQAGRHEMLAPNEGDPMNDAFIELTFETNHYFAEIPDPTMKSFRLLGVRQE
jgi:lysophospholipase L1-like esterase